MAELTLQNLVTYIKKNFWLLVRYGVSGVAGIVANLILFSLAVEYFGVWYIFGALIGFVAAYIVTFSMHKWWTFTSTPKERTFSQGVLYLASALGTLVINTVLLYIFVEWFEFLPVLGQFVALGISAVLSFLFTSQITFHADEERWQKFWHRAAMFVERMSALCWYPLLLLAILSVLAIARLTLVPITFSSDAEGYVATAQFIAGDGGRFEGARFLKPLAPGVVAVIATNSDTMYPTALLVQAFLGFLILGLAAYWLGLVIWNDTRAGFVLAIISTTPYPMLRYGLDTLTETGAWAAYFAALATMFLWYKKPATKWLWLTSLLLLFGLLWKEYAVLAGLVFGLVIIFQPLLSIREKVWAIIQGLCLTILPWGIWQAYVYKVYEYSYLDWLSLGVSGEAYQNTYTLLAIIKSMTGLLLFVWVFVFLGVWYFGRLSKNQKRFVLFLLIPSFGFLAWGWVSTRLFFSLVPLAAILATHGLRTVVPFRYQTFVLLFIGVTNLAVVWLAFNPDVRTMLNDFAYDDSRATEQPE